MASTKKIGITKFNVNGKSDFIMVSTILEEFYFYGLGIPIRNTND